MRKANEAKREDTTPSVSDEQRLGQIESDIRAIASYLVDRDQLRHCGFAKRLVEISEQVEK